MSESESPATQPFYRRLKRWQMIALVVFVALVLRLWAAWQLPLDADEPTYLRAGQEYARMLRSGDLNGILNYEYNREHPALVKLMYSLPYLLVEPRYGVPTEFYANRLISAAWGVLAVLVMSLIDPLAGLLLALDSMVIKYTSEVYLESFPLFAGLLAVYAFRRYAAHSGKQRWLWISAAGLGAAAAGKYLYVLLGIAVLALFWQMRGRSWRKLGLYALVSAAVFLILDPAVWANPPARLWESLAFHWSYSQGSLDVQRANYPWYQAINWISAMVPWHPQVFFFPAPDVVIFLAALVGLWADWRKKQAWTIAWGVGLLAVLLAWPTKWPQYTLMLIPALCLLAASGLRRIWNWLVEVAETWNLVEGILPHPGKVLWITLGIFLVGITGLKVEYEVRMTLARSGWSSVVSGISPLPADAIHDIAAARDGRMLIATDAGLAIWRPTDQAPWGDSPTVLTRKNSGLPGDRVLALLEDAGSGWWIATDGGVSRWDGGGQWKTYPLAELGITGDILCLAQDGQGQLWVGTTGGAAVFDGQRWKPVSGLPSQTVFSIARQDGSLWFATLAGASRLEPASGAWQHYDLSQYGLGWAGVSDMAVDRAGKLWVTTIGDGVSFWDGKSWTTFRASNSSIPRNTATRLLLTDQGQIWVGFNYSAQPGGILARYDRSDWLAYTPSNSGYSGGEPTALTLDARGQLWIGTAMNGLQIFQKAQDQ